MFPEVAVLLEDFRSPLVNAILDSVSRHLLRAADAVVVLGESMKQRLVTGKGADAGKMVIIHNWADTMLLAPATGTAFASAHHLRDRFVVMHAGNIGLSQNLEIVLGAAERLRNDARVRFVMVGDGARRAALEAAAARRGLANIVFLPYQPREAMRDSYAAADVFLVSLRAGLSGFIVPSKVYSIIAAGKPFIAAIEEDSEAVAIAREHGCGEVVPPGDDEALARAIQALADNPARIARMAHAARAAGALYDRPRQVAEYARLLARVAHP